MDCKDERKSYILDLICVFFELDKQEVFKRVDDDNSLCQFLDDVSCNFLRVYVRQDFCEFSNKLSSSKENNDHVENNLIFFKLKPEALTEANVKTSVFVMTQFGSPISTFHQALNNFYIPAMLNHNIGSEPQVQNTLKVLDDQLMFALYRSGKGQSIDMVSFDDEVRYWESIAKSTDNTVDKSSAKSIWKILRTVEDDLSSLDKTLNVDVEEVLESCTSVLDDLWRNEGNAYEQGRMIKLMEIIGNSVVKHTQKRMEEVDLWKDDYDRVIGVLNAGISACSKWNEALRSLCTVYWSSSDYRRWVGEPFVHQLCATLKTRLSEIKNVRSTHRQLTRLLSSSEQKELQTDASFSFFADLQPRICSSYSDRLWKVAMQQFEKSLVSMEQRVALKLKSQFNHLNANTLQLLQEIKRYEELLKRPNIASHLTVERQNLLSVLEEYANSVTVDGEQDLPLLDLPPTVNKIYWTKLLYSKIKEIDETNNAILMDLEGSKTLSKKCESLLNQIKRYEKEQFDNWIYEVKEDIKVNELALSETSKVLRLKEGQMVEVNYPSRLVRLLREVQQLSAMGLSIPKSIKEICERAMKFMDQAKDLEQIANFHNTIGDRIIPSQKPMLLPSAQRLDSLINSQHTVTWSNTKAVDKYIANLQEVVKGLSQENNKLAFYHHKICDKMLNLLNTDLLRQQNFWKQTLRDVREIITQVEFMKFPNMKSWKLHWDYQLYKALEWQYRLSLCNLHLHFPEIKVELIYRQQKLQFHPPIEEIRMKYYSQVKRFLSIPKSFSGFSENTQRLFSSIASRNARRFEEVFIAAEELFERLNKIKKTWSAWMVLGGVNVEELTEKHLKVAEDWDMNYRTSKKIGQEAAKLHKDEQIGCITVSVLPIRAEIESHNRKYWDALTMSLQTSILRDINELNKYIADATNILNSQPKTISEVGEANMKHAQLMETSAEMQKSFECTVKKNKTLASWTKEKIEQVNQLIFSWDNFQNNLKNHKSLISRQVERMKIALNGETENLLSQIEKFNLRWEMQKPKDADIEEADFNSLKKNVVLLEEKLEEWNGMKEKKEKLEEECRKFEMESPQLDDFETIDQDLQMHFSIWSFYNEFHTELAELSKEDWILFRGKAYKFDEFLSNWEKRAEERSSNKIVIRILQEINRYKAMIPLFSFLRGDMFSDKHWLEFFMILGMDNKSPEMLTLGDFLAVRDRIIISGDKLQALNAEASSEITIRQGLGELDAWEVQARFTLTQHFDAKSNPIMLIKDFPDVLNKIGDHQCLLQSIINSPNSKRFTDRTSIWENKLNDLDELIGNMNIAQRKWVYLEPIFKNGSFAIEQIRFERVDQDFRYVMNEVSKDNRVMTLIRVVNLKQTLTTMIDQLNRCQNSLNQYLQSNQATVILRMQAGGRLRRKILQEKRSSFTRFYFLGDEDLLELLGQSAKEQIIQTHLKKLFNGINSVTMDNGFVTGINSLQGESVKLNSPVKVTTCIEEWLNVLNKEVKNTLKSLLVKYQIECDSMSVNPTKFPSQILCLGESLWFTENCEKYIESGKLDEFRTTVKEKMVSYSGNLENWNDGDNLLQLKLKALLSDTVHHLDIVDTLMEHKVSNTNDWYWQKQLRYYLDSDKNVVIRMVDAELAYTYEYQGNQPKLVWTPLTEKCFLTLTQSIKMGLGGNPFGPAGTGKTESVKALAGLLGRQILVFNCDKGIDVKSMGRIFVGLVKCGAWGCFDEFNRLEEATLSAVSMIIQPIQIALQENKKSVKILDEEVPMNPTCGLFVTLNPAGKKYGGRKKLPNNLKQLFRPVVMSVPDDKLIAQISLLCEGFKQAKEVGAKLVETFDLAKNLLSKQQHYDWGLRALKTVLGSCGSLFKESKRKKADSKLSEMEVAVEAVRLNTLSKLTFKDSVLFDKIVEDVFVGVKFIGSDFDEITAALKSSYEDLGLQYNEIQIKKCIELYEQMQQRMGVALVGPSGTGKTTIIKLLRTALQKLGRVVKHCVLNPKSMERTQFFGQVDVDTRQWNEGVLTATALKLNSENPGVLSWLICDGDIDPDWVEALNSVLDDNRLLTLPSGWRIQFGPNFNFLFETSDLNHASPATVSRMGVIHLSDQIVDISSVVNSWLARQTEERRLFLEPYISDHFYQCVEWVRKQGNLVVPYSTIGLVNSGLSHLENVENRSQLVMALIYGLGANLTLESRAMFAKSVFEKVGEFIPNPSKILECYYNKERKRIDPIPSEAYHSDGSTSTELSLVLTPTGRMNAIALEPWINSNQPLLICGPEGSGKTLLINYCLSKQPALEVTTIFCGQLITPDHVIQKLRQVCSVTTSSTGRILKPKNSQKLVLLFKNLELATVDTWGTNMLVTWLQQVIAYQGFYETDLEWTSLDRIQIIGTLTDGTVYPSTRFTSINRVYYLSPPGSDDLKAIYFVYVKSVIFKYFENYTVWTNDSKISSLVASIISVYEKVRSTFTKMREKHYSFSPKNLTLWCSEIQRYKIGSSNPIKSLLEVVTYVGFRLFYDRFINDEDKAAFKEIMRKIIEDEWNIDGLVTGIEDVYYSSYGNQQQLSKIEKRDWVEVVNKGIVTSLGKESEILMIDELLRLTSSIDCHFSGSNTSLILAGRSGIGRKTALTIVSSMQAARVVTLNMSQNYNVKSFKIDLKTALQYAGVEGESTYLVVEDYQIIDNVFLGMLNGLLGSGEVPDLYKSDELESVILSLKDVAATEGYSGSTASFFASRILKNLHVALILDVDKKFTWISENNQSLFSKSRVLWLPEWSPATMKRVPKMLLSGTENFHEEMDSHNEICQFFFDIHRQFENNCSTPRRFLSFVRTYIRIYKSKKKSITTRTEVLQAGVAKLNQTRIIVDQLKKEAADQKEKLAEKQLEASSALNLIGETMRNANTHKEKMEKLREQAVLESQQLTERKKAIDKELSEVKPLIEEARQAVGNIKNESLSEIRSLRAPPDAIRDILEGVLRLMGIHDTSWNNMKTFLAKRGVKEDIRTFDAHQITPESKDAVNILLSERSDSFNPKVAKRASVAAAPLAAWVIANIKYAMVLEKIRPLEKEQKSLQQNLTDIEDQVGTLSTGLGEVDEKVNDLKNRLNTYTREAAVIEIHLSKAQDTMASAQELLAKLEDEYERWTCQLEELTNAVNLLPRNTLLGSAFLSYLSDSPEDVRRDKLQEWEKKLGGTKFSLMEFLASEQDRLKWITEGLSADRMSYENAVVILESWLHPFLIDPTGMAANWLKNHFANKNLEILSQHSPKLQIAVEFAVRFGKALIIEEVDEVHPILVPLLRKDIICQGPREIIYVGDKPVDYNRDFKLFLVTRNTENRGSPDATAISFTVTEQGLSGQLLALAVEQERPELGIRRSDLLKKEEEMKIELHDLQENLLKQLASAQGDILENKELINSLNQTKNSSEEISKALKESKKLESQLDEEYASYKDVADFGSRVFFTIRSLSEINPIYQFSVILFKKLFQKSLQSDMIEKYNSVEQQKNLVRVTYQNVSRSLFNSDRLAFALLLSMNVFSDKITPEEWMVFKGETVGDTQIDSKLRESLPDWIEEDRHFDINNLKNATPDVFASVQMSEINNWLDFSRTQECEKEVPKPLLSRLSSFQVLLLVQAFRPDRLYSAMTQFVLHALGIKTLSPASVSLADIAGESSCSEPILLLVSPGADPSEELRTLVRTMPSTTLHEIAMGEGQTETAMELLRSCSQSGEWLCLKNLHLMTSWLGELEKELKALKFHENFRLWLTTEPHEDFSRVLAGSCLKVTYEAPPGIKKNLQRTFASWSSDTYRRRGVLFGRTIFAAAWFHAVVQERRNYIPQGWSTFYEFSDSDLRASVDLIIRIFSQGKPSLSIDWTFIRGLLLNSIYGGRMDNTFDIEILGSYLREFFNESALNRGLFGPNLSLPSSECYSEYLQMIHQLNDFDKPSLFGLPENIERSWQKMKSSETVNQLKVMEKSSKTLSFDVANWQQGLSPLLTLWKKSNQSAGLIEIKLSEKKLDKVRDDPVLEFIRKDFEFGLRLVQSVHQTLAGINKVIRSVTVADAETVALAKSLLNHQTPTKWRNVWEGSENPFKYLSVIVSKAAMLQKMAEMTSSEAVLQQDLDLARFFQPDRFLKAFKQLSARKSKISLDKMQLHCKWTGAGTGSGISFRLKNLYLEGAYFDGRIFTRTTIDSPIYATVPPVTVSYIDKESMECLRSKEEVIFPVYQTSKRENLLLSLSVPCAGDRDEWYKTGAAFFLKD
ncbi:hypothetical protein RUM44_008246 [Polyplax serrata]|uniref:Cytoplasmic dynein 2 heavy chain 1 n=1 Tax=Polyplax serrata TaxID=468196 RepID=A0ABR1B9J2_POLSC